MDNFKAYFINQPKQEPSKGPRILVGIIMGCLWGSYLTSLI